MKTMKVLYLVASLALLICLGAPGPAGATLITFSEYPVGTVITTQYAGLGVIFSGGPSGGNPPIIANDGAVPYSPVLSPNPPYAGDFFATFTSGATGVSFDSGYWDTVASGVIKVYNTSSILIATLTDVTIGVDHIDLSGLGTIGAFYFNSYDDPFGADIGNLQFSSVPLPSALLLFGPGLAGLGALRRRFKK